MVETHIMDDRFFNESVVRHEVGKLRALLRAAPKWEEAATAEVNALAAADPGQMSEEQGHWHAEYINDRYSGIEETREALYRGFAVSTASMVETMMGLFCGEYEVALPRRPDWGAKKRALEVLIGEADLRNLPGFDSADRARILANCFKHNGGAVTDEYIRGIAARQPGEQIRYQDEDWTAVIDGIQSALLALVQRLPARA
jgi:hypothetical protein